MAKDNVRPRTREKRERVLTNFMKTPEYTLYKSLVKNEGQMVLPET